MTDWQAWTDKYHQYADHERARGKRPVNQWTAWLSTMYRSEVRRSRGKTGLDTVLGLQAPEDFKTSEAPWKSLELRTNHPNYNTNNVGVAFVPKGARRVVKVPIHSGDSADELSDVGAYFNAVQLYLTGRDPGGHKVSAFAGLTFKGMEYETDTNVLYEMSKEGVHNV